MSREAREAGKGALRQLMTQQRLGRGLGSNAGRRLSHPYQQGILRSPREAGAGIGAEWEAAENKARAWPLGMRIRPRLHSAQLRGRAQNPKAACGGFKEQD